MKKFLKKIAAFGLLAIAISSCSKDGETIVASSGSATTATATASTLVLSKSTQTNNVVSFTVTQPSFGYSAVITNTLQIAVKGTNFAKVSEATFDANTLTKVFTGAALNSLVLKLGVETEKPASIEARIKSSISDQYTPTYSNVIQMTVTPYSSVSWLYVPGAYQGWNPATADSLKSPTSNGIYEGIINFTTGNLEFKLLTKKSWGTPEYGSGSGSGTTAVGGGNLAAPSAGSMKLSVDLNANTITYTPYSFGVIGSATPGGWTTDTDMTFNNGTQTWSVTVPLVAGDIKFRLNDDWGTNYGGSNGVAVSGGDNIAVSTAGTYRVTFSPATATYSLTKL